MSPAPNPRPRLESAPWPANIRRILDLVRRPRVVRELLALASRDASINGSDTLRALEILLLARLVVHG